MPNLRNSSKGGFEPGRGCHSTVLHSHGPLLLNSAGIRANLGFLKHGIVDDMFVRVLNGA